MNKNQAEQLLKVSLQNPNVQFRDGQWEAIDTLVNQRQKLLVVQRTGWGKSAVYFISTRIFRNQGYGPTIIVSPLLALMRNQIQSATYLGLIAETINSTNKANWQNVTKRMVSNEIDCLLISPERLANDEFVETVLQPIADRVALIVIDEAHCISDWGHDFRPDYRRIINILRLLPENTPILGTTATANNRVLADIKTQFGDSIQIQRGVLSRDSLSLQTLVLPSQAERLAWLAQTIPAFKGTGIVYVLTKHDAETVANWLIKNGIDAKPYYSGVTHTSFVNQDNKLDSDAYRNYLEDSLIKNELKVLVATTALGMGYDKPDLSFVIHYQAPSSIVGYYQQVGRAGRNISRAFGLLMSGREDDDIHEFFRETAFPSEQQVNEVLDILAQSDGLSLRNIEELTNLRYGQIEKVLKLLNVENPAPVIKIDSKWYRTTEPYLLNKARIAHLAYQREQEWADVKAYIKHKQCKMMYLRKSLDDDTLTPCGKCESCIGHPIINPQLKASIVHNAKQFLLKTELTIQPKIQVATNAFLEYDLRGNLPVKFRAEEGRVLSRWGDAGWGKLVVDGKRANQFSDSLIGAVVDLIDRWKPLPKPAWICCVPSMMHPDLVPDFAKKLANALELPFMNVITKVKMNQPQKLQQNRFHQCQNLDGVFAIETSIPNTPVLLVDDIVDSGWTLAILTALLRKAGSGPVFPIALATTSVNDP
jgi:ATP-dependent DNA helicase RecQ